MVSYRFYWLKPDGRIDTASNFEFADDAAALDHAQSIRDGGAIEVWQGARRISRLGEDDRKAV
jgi:hypothetical protein